VDSEVEAQQAFIVTGSASGDSGEAALVVTKDGCSDNEARAVIGFEQAGASATQAEQKFFFDFLIDRELKWKSVSLWGNVRVSSYPQQISTPLAQFDIASAVGQLPVNKLAETASFLTGFDIHLKRLTFPVRAGTRRLGFIGSFGATGPFTPEGQVALFAVPNSSSPQYSPFTAQFPQAKGSTYVGFVPPRPEPVLPPVEHRRAGDNDVPRAPGLHFTIGNIYRHDRAGRGGYGWPSPWRCTEIRRVLSDARKVHRLPVSIPVWNRGLAGKKSAQ